MSISAEKWRQAMFNYYYTDNICGIIVAFAGNT